MIALDDARESKVRHLDVAVAIEQKLLGLEATVVDALGMRRAQRMQGLQQVAHRDVDRNILGVGNEASTRAIGCELGDDVWEIALQIDVVNRDNVGMRQGGRGAHDIGESAHDFAALVIPKKTKQFANFFKRHFARKRHLTRAIHRANTTRADRCELFVARINRFASADGGMARTVGDWLDVLHERQAKDTEGCAMP